MKALYIKGQIKKYDKLPSTWGNVLGVFGLLSVEEFIEYGCDVWLFHI